MIWNQWYGVLESKEVKKGKPVGVTRVGEKLVFWRDTKGNLCCIHDRCCHRGASLAIGELCGDNIACPFHAFQYDKTGSVKVIPAIGKNSPVPPQYKVKGYTVKESYGIIWLWYGDDMDKLPPVKFFDDLDDSFCYASLSDQWPVHYSRSIENQLDVVHVPIVHRTTIGRGGKTLVNGPVVKYDGELLHFYVDNINDDGKSKPVRADRIKDYEKLFQLQFRFPNVWQNLISDKVRVAAIFAPVDEENSVVYVRFYQKFLNVPVLRNFVNYFANIFNLIVLRQDKRVVITQLPKKTSLVMDEKLIAGDMPIIEYRKIRDSLMKQKKKK